MIFMIMNNVIDLALKHPEHLVGDHTFKDRPLNMTQILSADFHDFRDSLSVNIIGRYHKHFTTPNSRADRVYRP